MRRPRVRFTLGRIMVAVALIAIVLYAENDRRRSETEGRRKRYLWHASESRRLAGRFRQAYASGETNVIPYLHTMPHGATLPLVLKWAQYHENRSRKYELAASRPWEPAPPDPPLPEVVPHFVD